MDDDAMMKEPDVTIRQLLWEALEAHAEQQLSDELDNEVEVLLRGLAEELLEGQSQLFVERFSRVEDLLKKRSVLLDLPRFRYVVELELAYRALRRVNKALERYLTLDFGTLARPLTVKAKQYVAEVVATYALGFDTASMALCRATMEQILKDALISGGFYTQAYLDRSDFVSAKWLITEAKKTRTLSEVGYEAGSHQKKGQRDHAQVHPRRASSPSARARLDQRSYHSGPGPGKTFSRLTYAATGQSR
ncbi:MAG: hypothetical protein LC775_20285 [Acidobacteria bacterium]|nr:hypothetical protein [Acidobacteriota bacterium]